jgi:hypothetical protein
MRDALTVLRMHRDIARDLCVNMLTATVTSITSVYR